MVKLNWDSNDFEKEQDSSGISDGIDTNGKLSQGYQHGSLTRGLVAYYPMEESSSSVLHDGANNNLGQIQPKSSGNNTSVTDMWTSNSKVGNSCLSFDGTDDRVDIGGDSIEFESGDPYTISAWVSFGDLTNIQAVMAVDSSDGSNMIRMEYDTNDGTLTSTHWDGSTSNIITYGSSVSTGTWYHVTQTYDGNTLKFYVDGVSQGTSSTTSLAKTASYAQIGCRALPSTVEAPLTGKVDDVRIYDRALSEPEVKALYNSGNGVQSGTKKTENMVPSQNNSGVSRYNFNDNLTDSWSSNNGTHNGTQTGYTTGVYGQAKNFNGTDEYISIENNINSTKEDKSVSSWIKVTDLSTIRQIIGSRDSNGYEFNFYIDPDGGVEFNTYDGSTLHGITSGHSISAGKWYHLTGVYKESEGYKLYVNGRLTDTNSDTTFQTDNLNEYIGARNQSSITRYFKGTIDDLRIYNKALTPVEVEKLYNKGAYRIPGSDTLQ